jgi:hypothetical protein
MCISRRYLGIERGSVEGLRDIWVLEDAGFDVS